MGGKQFDRCTHCKRPYSQEDMAKRKEAKIQNALNSRAKAEANGRKVVRKRKAIPLIVKEMRKQGFRVKDIAARLGCSVSAVHRALASPPQVGAERAEE